MKRTVLYLRVSTKGQVQTDYDPEGISLPAQRAYCEQKGAERGLTIIGEYLEPGRSATSMAKRPAFQEMLKRIAERRDVDVVLVYSLSRLNRNQFDAALVWTQLQAFGVELMSATEHIDSTPQGMLMFGVLGSFNQFRSTSEGADIRYKMSAKARKGGTVTRAKIGYSNTRVLLDEGYKINTVVVDDERAPLIRLAFELCATGDYTMTRLADTLTDRGLRMRPQINRPAGPISAKYLTRVLRDRYYLGVIVHDGQEYPGRHEALVTPELFARVQAVLDGRLDE